MERAPADLGYVSVPEELLESDDSGPGRLEHFSANPSWWTRFLGTVW